MLVGALVVSNLAWLVLGYLVLKMVRDERSELLNRIQGAAVNWQSPNGEVTPVPYIHPDDDEQLAVLRSERDG
jgi:hypothetical protein